MAVFGAAVPAVAGAIAGALLELGDRSSCPLDGGACITGPTFGWLHPASPSFNHVFGALVFSATILLPLGLTAYLLLRLRARWSTLE